MLFLHECINSLPHPHPLLLIMAVLLSDYIVFFIFLGVLLLFTAFVIIRQLLSKRGSSGGSLRSGLKRMFSRRQRSHSFSFKSATETGNPESPVMKSAPVPGVPAV